MAVEVAKFGFLSNLSLPLYPFSPKRQLKFGNPFESGRKKLFSGLPSSSSVVDELQVSFTEPERILLEGLIGIQGRGRSASPQQLKDVELAVKTLEDLKGVSDPTGSSLIEGSWQLIFTTRPGTASPIQRTFVGVDFFKIFQEVFLRTDDPRVSNIVRFSDAIGELKVEAAATIKDGKRILFRFDKAAFSFRFLPFKVPYPVPFRLLGDEAKGWLDTTYLSRTGNMRISRGNKGTTFVLQKKTEPRQRLLSAISIDTGVTEVIDELISLYQNEAKENPEILVGEWQLLWSSQSEAESWLDVAVYGLKGFQLVNEYGRVANLAAFLPGIKFRVNGRFVISDDNMYDVTMDSAAVLVGILELPMEMITKFNLEILYIDNKIRITRGYRGIIFVHLCVSRPKKK